MAPVFAFSLDAARAGALVIESTEPEALVVVEVDGGVSVHSGPAPAGAARLQGRAADVLQPSFGII